MISNLNFERELQKEIIDELIKIIDQLKTQYVESQNDIWEVKRSADLYHEHGMSEESKYRAQEYAKKSRKFDSKKIEDTLKIISILNKEADTEYEKLIKKQFDWIHANSQAELLEKIKSGEIENKLKKLLDTQIKIESKFDQIVKGRFHMETDESLMMKYNEIQESIKNTAQVISESFQNAERHLKPEEIAKELFKEAIDIISTSTVTDEDQEKALIKLNSINANVLLTGKIVKQLPREEVAKLDLKKISHIEKLEDVSGSELLNQPEVLSQIKQIIKSQFPDGDDEAFGEECKSSPNIRLTISLANKKVLSFFSKEQRSENIDYVDWFIANPDAPIKGLGEATLRLGFDSGEEGSRSYYAVAKPHAKSFQILIENLGFVGFNGSTEDGEYKHHYTRIRRFASDTKFKSKNLTEDNKGLLLKTLDYACSEDGVMQDIIFEGKMMRACRVVYHGQTHHDDIKKTDPDGWIMEEINKQNKKGYVLTRFIPQSSSRGNQAFYAVFEKDSASVGLRDELAGVISPESSSHSVSKKALSN